MRSETVDAGQYRRVYKNLNITTQMNKLVTTYEKLIFLIKKPTVCHRLFLFFSFFFVYVYVSLYAYIENE